jgi:serine/threonine protein phosphatase PrpC
VNFQWASATHRGRVRNNNEDSYAPETSGQGTGPLVVMVADGMGGAVGGEVASSVAVARAVEADGGPRQRVAAANEAVYKAAIANPNLAGMGTTLTLAEFSESGTAIIAHVGDSRAYLWRRGRLEQLTVDHTVVAEQIAAGRLTPHEASRHPQRSMLTRVLGMGQEIEIDEMEYRLEPGDRLLVCSDGLTNMVAEDEIAEVLGRAALEEAAWELVERANQAGGQDNITVVVVEAEP